MNLGDQASALVSSLKKRLHTCINIIRLLSWNGTSHPPHNKGRWKKKSEQQRHTWAMGSTTKSPFYDISYKSHNEAGWPQMRSGAHKLEEQSTTGQVERSEGTSSLLQPRGPPTKAGNKKPIFKQQKWNSKVLKLSNERRPKSRFGTPFKTLILLHLRSLDWIS